MRAALVQMSATDDVAENLARTEANLEAAKGAGADVVCLQECFNTWFFAQRIDPRAQALAEPIDGLSVSRMRAAAKRLGLFVVVPFYERAMAGELYNTAILVDDGGEIRGTYRKHHLPMSSHFNEKFYFRPGNTGFPVFATPHGRVGIMICYDRHFPESARALGLGGAEYVFVPTATTTRGYSRSVWETELRAHANRERVLRCGGEPGRRRAREHLLRGERVRRSHRRDRRPGGRRGRGAGRRSSAGATGGGPFDVALLPGSAARRLRCARAAMTTE